MLDVSRALSLHSARLLAMPGVTAVATGKKRVLGRPTSDDAIVVFVSQKRPRARVSPIPAEIAGFPTDVVQRRFRPEPMVKVGFKKPALYTDMHKYSKTLFPGLSIGCSQDAGNGTIACFIRTTGRNANPRVPAGVYLLTCAHVVEYANHELYNQLLQDVVQPEITQNDWRICGTYVAGFRDNRRDCAIVRLDPMRGYENKVPVDPAHAEYKKVAFLYTVKRRHELEGFGEVHGNAHTNGASKQVARLTPGDEVYKFGATTGYTRGQVLFENFCMDRGGSSRTARIEGALYIENPDGEAWAGPGDSGSGLFREADGQHAVVGLNFQEDSECKLGRSPLDPCSAGLAYPIQSQVEGFGGTVTLA